MEGVKPNKTRKMRSGWKQNIKGQPIAVLVLVEGGGTPRECWDFDPPGSTKGRYPAMGRLPRAQSSPSVTKKKYKTGAS